MKILITGGAGFIGSHVIRYFERKYPQYILYNIDKLGYAGHRSSLSELEAKPNYHFIHGDIVHHKLLCDLFKTHRFQAVIHLAAETHVDRSIRDGRSFVRSNLYGTGSVLEAAYEHWKSHPKDFRLFYHISTDEVYGSLGETGVFTEDSPYAPRSPYAATKAGSDHLVQSYAHTHGFPTLISHSSNNYGPFQHPEKLIPMSILSLRDARAVPLYGDGKQRRDWLYVEDHVRAIDVLFHQGQLGEHYNIAAGEEQSNQDLLKQIAKRVYRHLSRPEPRELEDYICFVQDRPGHDFRYAMDCQKIRQSLGWSPEVSLSTGLDKTVAWYLQDKDWLREVQS
ncbi:MAG: dTDP-glucose 4,6-dehydratase [Cytophagales bacterium]|nr:dTDP-glucose 4,6-dehydratase [Cytophagales bacterium]